MMSLKESVEGVPLNCTVRMDNYLKENVDYLHELTKNNWDSVGIIVGYEGDGKTRFAVQVAYYLDPNFNIDNIVFNAAQFDDAVETLPHGSSIVWDEADDLAGHWADEIVIAMKRKFKRIRKKRMKIFLVTPTFHDLGKYFAITRARFLIHIYSMGLERGYFRFFNRTAKKNVYILGKKLMDLSVVKATFHGSFEDIKEGFPVDMSEEGEYEQKKDAATAEILDKSKTNVMAVKEYRIKVLERLNRFLKAKGVECTNDELSHVFLVNTRTIYRDLEELKHTSR